ncbi:MAG: prolyl oligopeptidase family serine peptidase [Thermomicrobiaceae bacterium]
MYRTSRHASKTRLVRTTGLAFISVLLLLLVIVGAVGWVASERALRPDIGGSASTLNDYPELQAESISFESQTGIELDGRFFAGTGDAAVILLHGFSEGEDQMLPHALFLNDAGFHVLTYNARHPDQYGDRVYSTLGAQERLDLVSAVDFLASRPGVNPERIGVYGSSLGGATAILGGALDARLRAIAAEGAFSDGDSVIDSSFERYIGLPAFPFGPAARQIAEWRAGAQLDDARPVDAIALIDDSPVLLIHGLDDESVPPSHSERNLAAAGENVDVWWVPGAGHVDAYQIAPDEYAERLVTFFDNALRQ